MKKIKTYMDKLMQDKEFREKFDVEYKKLCAEEKKAKENNSMLDKAVIKEFLEDNLVELKIPMDISKENLLESFCNYVEDDYYEWLNDNYKAFFNHGNPDWSWIKERTESNL